LWPQQPFRGGPSMHEYNTTATGYPWQRCTLVLNQGRSLSPLSFLISHTWPLSRVFPGVRILDGCFSEVRPASPVIQGTYLTPRSAEPGTMITHTLRGSEATTTQLHNHSTFNPRHCFTDPPPLECPLSNVSHSRCWS